MNNLKNFVGEQAYNIIRNIAVDGDALRRALVTPLNARAVFVGLSEFDTRALCAEISSTGTIGQIRESTQAEITEAFHSAGYDRIIFDDEAAISECEKYYKQGEVICTYNSLKQRMREYHMLVAVKTDIDKIERSENPQRDDEYGTSILNVQIARNGSHMSIKNRYNHTVSQPDSTLNNDLDSLSPGLQSMVLGHYGFASLNSKSARFNNIVNIDGVYLKYHTERNNVYFGAFVLDGVNGVRFTDRSRYYVTAGSCNDDHYNQPLVLDFKEKEAIDVCQNKEQANGKTPLMTRAMREGILSNTNKEGADTLTAVFQDAKRELLKSRKGALQYIHDTYGYDFAKPYKVTGFLGRFTAKSIENATGSSTGILLVYSKREMRVCELNGGKFDAKDLRRRYDANIDTFYRQGDFETERKSGITAVYVVQQEAQYIGSPKPEEKTSRWYGDPTPVLDKSGSDVGKVRRELIKRFAKYKAEKSAKEAADSDFTQDISDIKKSFAELKTEITMRFTAAETSNDYKKLNDVLGYNLTWLVREIESVQKHIREKSFDSVNSARERMEKIKSTILKLREGVKA